MVKKKETQRCQRCGDYKPWDDFEITKIATYSDGHGKEVTHTCYRRVCKKCMYGDNQNDTALILCAECKTYQPVANFVKRRHRATTVAYQGPRLEYSWKCNACRQMLTARTKKNEKIRTENKRKTVSVKKFSRKMREERFWQKVETAEKLGMSYGQWQAMRRREAMKVVQADEALQDM